jgi:AcrR family transcriptional regulator
MASKDRIQRLKEGTRNNILSMRKIADEIEYTAPMIYEYFANKEAILSELTIKGFALLAQELTQAKAKHRLPAKQLEAMWMAYWNFAFAEKEYYQLMFGVEMNCCIMMKNKCPELEYPSHLMSEVIRALLNKEDATEEEIDIWYYTFWSVIHGLVSLNFVRKLEADDISKQVLSNAISGIITRINQ